MTTLYGLKNCDTCKKARKWLERFDIAHQFVDVRETLPSPEMLLAWQAHVGGFEKLINKSSTTWRQLPENRKSPGSEAEWKLLLREHPALIKRPLLELADGRVVQGFSDNSYKKLFALA
ncbi:arsenate reductase [Lysobacteraceae bacterium NML95-0200]|nr:arsenate reductase [Xanthomonadaceae bacterium NML95-0200]